MSRRHLLFSLLAVFAAASFLSAQNKLYWSDCSTKTVGRSDPDGSNKQTIFSGLIYPVDVVVDNLHKKTYWLNKYGGCSIWRSNLDGSSNQLIFNAAGAYPIAGLDIDAAGGKLYWATQRDLYRCDLDGSNVEKIASSVGTGIAVVRVDVLHGKIYFTDDSNTAACKIARCNLNGSNLETLLDYYADGLVNPYGLALDVAGNKLYFSDFGTGTIKRTDLNGGPATAIVSGLGEYVDMICLHIPSNSLYFANYADKIRKVNLTTLAVTDIITGQVMTSGVGFYEAVFPEIDVTGNGRSIATGDASPSVDDFTDFGSTMVAGGTVTRTFTISNTGAGLLMLTSTPKVTITGAQAGDFSVSAQPSVSEILPGGNTTFQVTFDPSASGIRSAQVNIANDDANEGSYTFAIQGTGTLPTLTFTDGSAFVQSITRNTADQVLGRFALTADMAGAALSAVSVKLNGTRTGVSNIKFWSSADQTFGGDTQLGSSAADPGDGNSVSFSGFSGSVGTSPVYYFLTADIGATASGTVQAVIIQNSSLTFTNASLSGSISNALLSNNQAPLPVELVSFAAKAKLHDVQLQWSTASELNNYGFEIERNSVKTGVTDGWQKIGLREGAGTTSTPQSYLFTDRPGAGTFEYRLKQIDRNGSFAYSSILTVNVSAQPSSYLVRNFPNPFNPETKITYTLPADSRIRISVWNTLGQEVAVLKDGIEQGGTHDVMFHAGSNASGMYFGILNAASLDGKTTTKLVQKMMLAR